MTATRPAALRLTEPSELIEAIPYLLGFHPSESLVLVGFVDIAGGRRQVGLCVRVDLPPPELPAEDLAMVTHSMMRSGVTSAVAVVLTSSPGERPTDELRWAVLAHTLHTALAAADVVLDDLLVATAETWWSVSCERSDCCPPEGRPRANGCSVAAAEATVAGIVALPDRESVAQVLAPCPDRERARLSGPLGTAEGRLLTLVADKGMQRVRQSELKALLDELDRRGVASGAARTLTPRRAARYAVALTDVGIRDGLWLAIDEGSVHADSLMLELLRRLPSPYDAAPLFLFGWNAWRHGNGTLASMAADRALESDPGYTAARLLLQASQGVDPRTVPPLREPIEWSC